jgi:Cu/Zn superoxide dismutase
VTIFSAALLVVVVGGPTTAVQAHGRRARTTLRDAAGHEVGRVKFVQRDGKVIVSASVTRQTPGFHGSHIHANDDPANGQGCIADPAQAPSTWLVSADGHLKAAGQNHFRFRVVNHRHGPDACRFDRYDPAYGIGGANGWISSSWTQR